MDFYSAMVTRDVENWLRKNPERLNLEEIQNVRDNLHNYLNCQSPMCENLVDIMVDLKYLSFPSRHVQFASYLNKKYKPADVKRVLDVGAGRMCHFSREMAKLGFNIDAFDPEIRLSEREAKRYNIALRKAYFKCDKYSDGVGTDITDYGLITGIFPCAATEHIIRQSLKYDKPFELILCGCANDGLNGQKFDSSTEWVNYLKSLSSDIVFTRTGFYDVLTNNPEERE